MFDFKGIIVPLLTPLTAHGGLDEAGLGRLADRLLKAGVHGLFAAGTTGEFLALAASVRVKVFECVCRAAGGAVPVVAGVSAANLEEIVGYAQAAAQCGAAAVSLLPPPYFPMTEAELGEFYDAALERMPLPVILYNFPALSGKPLTPALVRRLAAHPKVAGMKDSSGSADYFYGVLAARRDAQFRLLIGSDTRLAEALARGADGGVPGIANLVPELCVRIYELVRQGDPAGAQSVQAQIVELVAPFKNGEASWLEMIRWMKRRLHEEGVCAAGVAGVFGNPVPGGYFERHCVGV